MKYKESCLKDRKVNKVSTSKNGVFHITTIHEISKQTIRVVDLVESKRR